MLNELTSILTNYITNTRNNVLTESFEEKSKYKQVLSEEGIKQLNKLLYKDSSKTNSACPIYYIDFEDDSEVIELPCNHCFIPEAIEKWLKQEKNECPICRFKLKSKEVKIESHNNLNQETNNILPLLTSIQNAYHPTRNRLFEPSREIAIPHSYIELLMAREERLQIEEALLESLNELEETNNSIINFSSI